jgi:hypothetical protein
MFLVQVNYDIPTNDGVLLMHTFFRARLAEATDEAAIEAFENFMENYPYKNKNKDQAVYTGLFIEKKLK